MIEKDRDISRDLLTAPPRVINIGLDIFAADLASQDAQLKAAFFRFVDKRGMAHNVAECHYTWWTGIEVLFNRSIGCTSYRNYQDG